MKIVEPDEWGNRLRSQGKVLEITPLIYTVDGSVLSLPPVSYTVPNWLLGMAEESIIGYPLNMVFNERMTFPYANTRIGPGNLSFLVRVVEYQPESMPQPATFDMEAVGALLNYLKAREAKDVQGT